MFSELAEFPTNIEHVECSPGYKESLSFEKDELSKSTLIDENQKSI